MGRTGLLSFSLTACRYTIPTPAVGAAFGWTPWHQGHLHKEGAFADHVVGDADAVSGLCVLDSWLHCDQVLQQSVAMRYPSRDGGQEPLPLEAGDKDGASNLAAESLEREKGLRLPVRGRLAEPATPSTALKATLCLGSIACRTAVWRLAQRCVEAVSFLRHPLPHRR